MFVGSLLTEAVKFAVVPMLTMEDGGLTATATPATVIVVPFEMLESVTEAAVTVTVKALARGIFGAV